MKYGPFEVQVSTINNAQLSQIIIILSELIYLGLNYEM